MSDNGRCKTCGGEGEIETGQTTAARCVDCGGTGKTGGEPPNPPLTVDEFAKAYPDLAASAAAIVRPGAGDTGESWEAAEGRIDGQPAELIEAGKRLMAGPNPPIRVYGGRVPPDPQPPIAEIPPPKPLEQELIEARREAEATIKALTPHFAPGEPDQEYKHRGGYLVSREPMKTIVPGEGAPEVGGPPEFFAEVFAKLKTDQAMKATTDPVEIKLEMPKPVEFSLKDLTESVIKPGTGRRRNPDPDFRDLELPVRSLPPDMAAAIRVDEATARAAEAADQEESQRRFLHDPGFYNAVKLLAAVLRQAIDRFDGGDDVKEACLAAILRTMPAVERLLLGGVLKVGDRMLFSSELLGAIAAQTLNTPVRVAAIVQDGDGTKRVVLEPCTD